MFTACINTVKTTDPTKLKSIFQSQVTIFFSPGEEHAVVASNMLRLFL